MLFNEEALKLHQEQALTVPGVRRGLHDFIEYMYQRPTTMDYIEGFSKLRRIDKDILIKQRCFMLDPDEFYRIDEIPIEFRNEAYGICKYGRIFLDARFVIPVLEPAVNSAEALPMGFVGYDKFAKPKYLDSPTYGYKPKQTTLLGMEELNNYYRSNKPVFITEGSMCLFWLRSHGFHALAMLGSYLSPYVLRILNRLENVVLIPDSDETGLKLYNIYKNIFPIYRTPLHLGKDIDEARLNDESRVISDLKNYIKNF